MKSRPWIHLLAGFALIMAIAGRLGATQRTSAGDEPLEELRVGYQKGGPLLRVLIAAGQAAFRSVHKRINT